MLGGVALIPGSTPGALPVALKMNSVSSRSKPERLQRRFSRTRSTGTSTSRRRRGSKSPARHLPAATPRSKHSPGLDTPGHERGAGAQNVPLVAAGPIWKLAGQSESLAERPMESHIRPSSVRMQRTDTFICWPQMVPPRGCSRRRQGAIARFGQRMAARCFSLPTGLGVLGSGPSVSWMAGLRGRRSGSKQTSAVPRQLLSRRRARISTITGMAMGIARSLLRYAAIL